ncbi:hypothetical protein GE061_012636 [Apolygus lucorum]|uniref:Armadillo repeat-containing domain-containing protein n=1 Tax=Apolygus lucorum TaxID=248454 RepID=A0A6A4JJB0_APOLU|nr:hypothetical protein GE061_012636 [Apolygus lucorum]
MRKSIKLYSRSRSSTRSLQRLVGLDSAPLRIGQLSKRKDFDGSIDEDEDDISFSDSELEEVEREITPEDPWYLKGIQSKEIEFLYFSDRDESTESEGDVLGDTEDDFSTVDEDSDSSSEEDEVTEKKAAESEEEEEEVEEEVIKPSEVAKEEISNKACPENASVRSPSTKSDRSDVTFTSGSSCHGELSRMNVNMKLAVTDSEMKDAEMKYHKSRGHNSEERELMQFNEEKAREITETLLKQKLSLFEQDMSAYLTGKKKEDAMRDTMRGHTYWRIRKTLKFLKHSDPFSTFIGLYDLMECDIQDPDNHAAIDDTGSVELFVNLLGVDWSHCRVGALMILEALTENSDEMVTLCMNLGMVREFYKILVSDTDEEIMLAVRCLCNLVSNKRSRTVIRKSGLLPPLFHLIHRNPTKLLASKLSDIVDPIMHRKFEIALGALYILTANMRSRQVRDELYDCGFLSIIVPLLGSREHLVTKAILEGLVLCASSRKFRRRFELYEFVNTSNKHWKNHEELVLRFLYRMSIGVIARKQIYENDGLSKIVSFVMNTENMRKDPYGFKYALECIHRMGANHEAREYLCKYDLLEPLIRLLKQEPPSGYQLAICSILAILSIYPHNWKPIVDLGGLQCALDIIFNRMADMWLIAHCLKILADLAHGEEAREVLLDQPYTLHFLLMLLNTDGRPVITRYAARAITPLTRVYTDFAEVIKSEPDCLEILMDQLEPMPLVKDDNQIKATVCEALAAITCEQNILEILSTLNLTGKICTLIKTDDESIQESVCLLISMCAISPEFRAKLGDLGIIERLASFMKSKNIHVVIAAAHALWRSSFNIANSLRMLNEDVIEMCLQWSSSEYEDLREAALGVLKNVRFAAALADESTIFGTDQDHLAVIPTPEWTFPYNNRTP